MTLVQRGRLGPGRITTLEQVNLDNEQCDFYCDLRTDSHLTGLHLIVSQNFRGEIVYPDLEISRYRPFGDALMFDGLDAALECLDRIRDGVWFYNIYQGVTSDGDVNVEKWGASEVRDLYVCPLHSAADMRKVFNNFRIDSWKELAAIPLFPSRIEWGATQ